MSEQTHLLDPADPLTKERVVQALVDDAWVGHDRELTLADLDRITEVALAAVAGTTPFTVDPDALGGPPLQSPYLASFVRGLRDWDLINSDQLVDLGPHAVVPAAGVKPEVEAARRKTAHEHLMFEVLMPWVRLSGNATAITLLADADLDDVSSVRRAVGAAAGVLWEANAAQQASLYAQAAGRGAVTVRNAGGDMFVAGAVQVGAQAGFLAQLGEYQSRDHIEDACRLVKKVAGVVFGHRDPSRATFDGTDEDPETSDSALMEAVQDLVWESRGSAVLDAVADTDWDGLLAAFVKAGMAQSKGGQEVGASAAVREWFKANPVQVPETFEQLAAKQSENSAGMLDLAGRLLGTDVKGVDRG